MEYKNLALESQIIRQVFIDRDLDPTNPFNVRVAEILGWKYNPQDELFYKGNEPIADRFGEPINSIRK